MKRPKVKVLYHYTNYTNAIQILSSGELWMFRSNTMNDPTEISHGLSTYFNVLERMLAESETIEQRRILGRYYLDAVRVFNIDKFTSLGIGQLGKFGYDDDECFHHYHSASMRIFDHRTMYMFSLSESPLHLDMWRAYADNGRGIALGFSTAELCSGIVQNSSVKVQLDRVKYGTTHLEDKAYKAIKASFKRETVDVWRSAQRLYREIVLTKAECYSSENEWRLFVFPKYKDQRPQYHHMRNRPRPYLRFTSQDQFRESSPITEIWTGPCSEFDGSTDETWMDYLFSHCMIDPFYVTLHHANLPYRNP